MRTRKQKAAALGEYLSGRRRRLVTPGMGAGRPEATFTREQSRHVEEACQRWLDSWVLPLVEDLLPKGEIRDAFLKAANDRTVPPDVARADAISGHSA